MTAVRAVAVAGPAIAITLYLLAQGLSRGPTLDASVFAQVAEQLRAGDVPYRDVFDHKPPGIYVAEAGLGTLLPWVDPWTRAWLITAVAAVGTLVLLAGYLVPTSVAGAALGLMAVAPGLSSHAFAQGGGYTESLAVLPATAGFLVAARGDLGDWRRPVAAGMLVATAVVTSFHLAPAAGASLALLIARGGRARSLAAFALGGSTIAVSTIVWLALIGALPAALEQIVAYNRAYALGASVVQPALIATAIVVTMMIGPAVAAALVRVLHLVRQGRIDAVELGAVVWIGLSLTIVIIQRQFFGHYILPLVAPLAILATPTLGRLADQIRLRGLLRLTVLALLLVSLALPIPFVAAHEPGPDRRDPVRAASALLAQRVPSNGRVFVWGNEPLVYLWSGRPPAGRFIYLFPLTHPRYTTPTHIDEVLQGWLADPPQVVVDASYHPTAVSAHPLLGSWMWPGDRPADHLDPLRDFVARNYEIVDEVGPWVIYAPR